MERKQAEAAIRKGSTAGYISAAFTAVVGVVVVSSASSEFTDAGLDGWLFADAALLVFLSWRTRRASRVASVTLVVYFLFAKILVALTLGVPSGGVVSLVFLYFFLKGAIGTFALHRIRSREDPDYRTPRRWLTVTGVVAASLLLGGMILGLVMETGGIPNSAVVGGDQLGDKVRLFLLDQGMIEPEEEIVLFYSAALFDFKKDGSVLTNHRVLSYEEVDGEPWFYFLWYDQIAEVEVEDEGGPLSDAIIAVYDHAGEGFRLWVSTEAGGLQRFLEELDQRMTEVMESGDDVPEEMVPWGRTTALAFPHNR